MQSRGAIQAERTSADGHRESVYNKTSDEMRHQRSSDEHAEHNSSRLSNGTTLDWGEIWRGGVDRLRQISVYSF